MNGVIVAFIVGALIGISVVLLVFEAIPSWREASKQIDADVRFLRSLPSGVERKDEQ